MGIKKLLSEEELAQEVAVLAWIDENPAVASTQKELTVALDKVLGHIEALESRLNKAIADGRGMK